MFSCSEMYTMFIGIAVNILRTFTLAKQPRVIFSDYILLQKRYNTSPDRMKNNRKIKYFFTFYYTYLFRVKLPIRCKFWTSKKKQYFRSKNFVSCEKWDLKETFSKLFVKILQTFISNFNNELKIHVENKIIIHNKLIKRIN